MDKYKIIQVKESVFADNDREADRVRQQLKKQGTFLLNLMSSPGSGKTTTLLRTVEGLKDQLRMGVMEADIDSDVDAAARGHCTCRRGRIRSMTPAAKSAGGLMPVSASTRSAARAPS